MQTMRLHGVEPGKGHGVKLRWKASYWIASKEQRQEQGEIASLGLA